MNVDTGQFRAITAERDQLQSELPQIRGSIARLAEAIEKLVEAAVTNGRGQQGTLLRLAPRSER